MIHSILVRNGGSFVFESYFAGKGNSTVARLKGIDGYGYRMHRVSSPPAWPSAMSPACPEISRLIPECPALSLMPSNGPQEPRKTKSRSTCIRPVIASQDRPTASILWTPFPPCIQVLHLLPAAQAVLWPLTTTFLTLSWAWLFLRPTLPFWPPPLSSGTPLAFLCPRPCGQSAMQAAPAIAVQVFALAGRPGPCPGTSCLARQGARWRQRCLVFFPFRKPFDVGPQLSDALFSF